jgi:hypothetical protein
MTGVGTIGFRRGPGKRGDKAPRFRGLESGYPLIEPVNPVT